MADALVFDVGGTNLRAGRYSFATQQLVSISRKDTPNAWNTPSDVLPFEQLYKEMTLLSKELFEYDEPEVVTIGFPGPITPSGELLSTPTIWGERFKGSSSIIPRLKSFWPNSNVHVLNDISAAGYFLKDIYPEDFCVISVSSGIGSKLFINGKPYTGVMGRGGEIGHWVTDDSHEAPICDCGGKGHLGGICSGRGVLGFAKTQSMSNHADYQKSYVGKIHPDCQDILNETLVTAYLKGDAWTVSVIDKTARQLARAIALIHTTTGIELFIIIGGFSTALSETYRRSVADLAATFCWNLGQNWNEMVKIGPEGTEIGLAGAGRFSETVRKAIYENK